MVEIYVRSFSGIGSLENASAKESKYEKETAATPKYRRVALHHMKFCEDSREYINLELKREQRWCLCGVTDAEGVCALRQACQCGS